VKSTIATERYAETFPSTDQGRCQVSPSGGHPTGKDDGAANEHGDGRGEGISKEEPEGPAEPDDDEEVEEWVGKYGIGSIG